MEPSRDHGHPTGHTTEVDVAEPPPGAPASPHTRAIGLFDVMTYQIHRYPAELIDVVHPTNGERIVIRPVLPQDGELMVAFFQDLR